MVRSMLEDMFYENDTLSLTRVLAVGGYVTFALGSFYLLINNIHWSHYDMFASYTGGAGVALQFGNKFINSKYNSMPGSYEDANGNGIPDYLENLSGNVKATANAISDTAKAVNNTAKDVGQVINTVKNTSDQVKEGINQITKLVKK